jgi:Dolichyl-phosphate-mannose-protein mannosyltransferase
VRVRWIPAWAVALTLVLAVGGGLRVEAAAHHGRFLSADERAYAKLAAGLSAGHGYNGPQMTDPLHWPPGTPMVFAAARLGSGARAGELGPPAVYRAQAVVGILLIAAVFALAALLAGPWAGVAAAAGVALYPPLVLASGDLVTEPLGALTLVTGILALVWAWRAPSWQRFALAGGALGVAVLVRPDLLVVPFALALLVAVTQRARRAGVGMGAGAAYLTGALLAIAPWSAYATQRRGAFVPVTTSSWSTLFVGTYLPGDGRIFGLREKLGPVARAHNPRIRRVADANLRSEWILDAVAARRPGLAREAALRRETLANLRRYAIGHPAAYAGMEVRKLGRMWLGYDRGTHHGRRGWVLVVHLLLVAGALVGLLAGLWRARRPALWAIVTTLLLATAVSAFFVAEARQSARLIPLLVAGGAAGAVLARRETLTAQGRGPAARNGPPPASGGAPFRPPPAGTGRAAARDR